MHRNKLGWPCLLVLFGLLACDVTEPIDAGLQPSYDTYTFGSYQLVTGSNWNSMQISSARLIGAEGGRLTLGLHELVVPRGAVGRPTMFRMTKRLGPHITVDLSATDAGTGVEVNSFQQPVELWLSYRFVRISNADLRRLVVLWLKDDSEHGEMVAVPTRVVPRTRHVVGSLTHFSQYAMGMN